MAKADISKLPAEQRKAVEARRAYQREWRARNREKIKAYEERYWLKRGSEQTADQAEKKA